MTHKNSLNFASGLRTTLIAAAVTLAAVPAALAGNTNTGLQNFLNEPTDFVVLSEGAPGSVTFASMMGNKLAIQYSVPTHAGDTFGEIVGTIDHQGVFVGNSVMITQDGQGRAAPVSMSFDDNGSLLASDNGANFVPMALYYTE
ncbi:MAG: hypothetical protein ABJN34_11005 [Litoreibacter sp.]|uniref:hypothetical protein n=1 Tax=Litoreibacter sp. TaxID=1969459 RepID=UPI00329799C0